MRKTRFILFLATCLFFSASVAIAQKAKTTATNADVVELSKAGMPESTIVLALGQSETNFDTSTKALIGLRKQNVSNEILAAMLRLQMKNNFLNPVDKKTKNFLTNADVVEMTKAGIAENVIILAIPQSNYDFDTSTKSLIELRKQGVSPKVLEAMLRRQTIFWR